VALAAALTLMAALLLADLNDGTYVYGASDLKERLQGVKRDGARFAPADAVPRVLVGAAILLGFVAGVVVLAR